jgi:MFS family permease
VYYGNTISSPLIIKLVGPRASLTGQIGWTLAIFAVAALPGYLLAAATIDRIGRRRLQAVGLTGMAGAFVGLWLIPGAATTLVPFLLLFGASYFFAEIGPNTTTVVYPAEIFPPATASPRPAGRSARSSALTRSPRCRRSASAGPAPWWPASRCWACSPRSPAARAQGQSLEEVIEHRFPAGAVRPGVAESHGTRLARA